MREKDPRWLTYYEPLGRFYHAFTDVEHQLACMVGNVVSDGTGGVKFEVSKAVLGGMRMAALRDTVKRLLRVFEASGAEIAAIDKVFAQLGDIQFLRDRLAHHWTRPMESDGMWRNDDFANVRELSKSQKFTFHISALTAATEDLESIKWYIDPLFEPYVTEKVQGRDKLNPFELPAWQYKSSMLIRDRPISGGKKPQPRQPKASGQ